jgi:hypothetical protein
MFQHGSLLQSLKTVCTCDSIYLNKVLWFSSRNGDVVMKWSHSPGSLEALASVMSITRCCLLGVKQALGRRSDSRRGVLLIFNIGATILF